MSDAASHEPATATIRFRGHLRVRAEDSRVIEILEGDEWVDRLAVLGLGAIYEPAALAALRGRVCAKLEVNGLIDRFEATMVPTYRRGTPLVFRSDTKADARSLAWQCSKAAADIDRRLVDSLRAPGATGSLRLEALTNADIQPGTLTIISMPIGHQADLPPRALDTLATVDLILAEDTRVAAKALHWRGINTPIISCHEQNERGRAADVITRLANGQRLALITDAGTPLVSDPGYLIIQAALQSGAFITAVPGPSAALMAITVSGLPTARFRFAGFVPRREKEKLSFIKTLLGSEDTTVTFESAHRIKATLSVLQNVAPTRSMALCKDLTKRSEEILRGTIEFIATTISNREDIRGEYSLVVGPMPLSVPTTSSVQSDMNHEFIRALLTANCPTAPIVKALRQTEAISRKEAYARVQKLAAKLQNENMKLNDGD